MNKDDPLGPTPPDMADPMLARFEAALHGSPSAPVGTYQAPEIQDVAPASQTKTKRD